MTTKNLEFDLQLFARETVSSNDGSHTLGGVSDTATISATANTGLAINAGWFLAASDSTIVTAEATYSTDTTPPSATYSEYQTDTTHTDTFTYAAFSSTATDATVATSIVTLTATTSDTTTAGIDAPTTGLFENTVAAAPVTLQGGGAIGKVSLSGVGYIDDFTKGTSSVVLDRNGSNLRLTGVSGEAVTLSPVGGTLTQTINGAAVKATVDPSANVVIDGSNASLLGLSANSTVNLDSISSNQQWTTNSNAVSFKGTRQVITPVPVSTTEAVSITSGDTAGSYLAANFTSGSVKVSTPATSAYDTVKVNGTDLYGAGKINANVSIVGDSASVLAVSASKAGALAAGSASVGGVLSSIAAGGVATVNNGVISGVSSLTAKGTWKLGDSLTSATLGSNTVDFSGTGSTITAGTDGAKVGGITYGASVTAATLKSVGTNDVTLKSSDGTTLADWQINTNAEADSVTAAFDSAGNLNVSTVTGAPTSVVLSSSNGNKTLAAGNADTLVLSAGGTANIAANNVVMSVSSLAGGTDWTVKGGTDSRTVSVGTGSALQSYTFSKATDSVYGVLTASSTNGASIEAISSLTGNVSVYNATNTISGLKVAGNAWTISAPGSADFNSVGTAATVSAYSSDLSVTAASTDASVQLTMTNAVSDGYSMRGAFNGVQVMAHDGDGTMTVKLENQTTGSGVAGLTSLNSGATVIGDNEYSVNEQYKIHKDSSNLANVNTQFTLGSGDMTIKNVVNNDSYSVTGGTVYYDIESSLVSGGSASVTVNGAGVAVTASSDSAVRNAVIVSNDSDAVVSVSGVRINDTVTTTADTKFGVTFNTSNVDKTSTDATKPYTMKVNNVEVSLTGASFSTDTSTITMNVDNSSASKPQVTISAGLTNNETVTVGAGYYVVGGNAAVEISDPIGYLYINNAGAVTGEDKSVADVRIDRESSIKSAVDSINNTVQAYTDFYNVDYSGSKSFASTWTSTVAGYSAATVSSPTTVASSGGVNIYGNSALGGALDIATLQSFIPNAIKIDHAEGKNAAGAQMGSAVIDVSNGSASLIALGMSDSAESFATSHTILGSARQSTIAVGPKATGNNVVRGGVGGNYIYHNASTTGGIASLYGGSGSDTIYAGPSDYVEGGTGKDYFFDSSAIEISDYNFEEGDVIIATKLSSNAALTLDKIKLNGNKMSIADSATITVGDSSKYDEATATRAVVANASNSNNTSFLIWAGNYETSLDASNFTKGAYMFSDINDGRADTLTGTSYVDTIYAGANDYVNSGAGNDIINLTSLSGSAGASVVLSTGMNSVTGWRQGFDVTSGANVLVADALSVKFKMKNDEVVAYAENSSISFNGLNTIDGAYRFLVGSDKISFIAANQTASVMTNADLGDYYKAERNGGIYVSDSVTSQFSVSLGGDQFTSINNLDLRNESRATVFGSSARETITAKGSAENGARKYIAAGDGDDLIISGGDSTVNSGNNLYFGSSGGTVFSGGRNTIQSYNYYTGSSNDPDMSHSDLLYLGSYSNYQGVNVTASQIEISLGDSDKVIIKDESGFSNTSKMVRAQFDRGDSKVYNIKFGLSTGYNTFTYDGDADIYWGNTNRNNDTLNVAAEQSNVNIWLADKRLDEKQYGGIGVINASLAADTKLTLAGSSNNNVIYAGGSNSYTSLWGGGGESNTLVGGAGQETFFYFKSYGYNDSEGNYHASNDVISNVDSNDTIWLYDVTLDDIDFEKTQSGIASGRITVSLKDGSALTVTNMSTETNFKISNGQGGWTDVKAINSGNNRHWE